jgi:hypothetical protein
LGIQKKEIRKISNARVAMKINRLSNGREELKK